MLTVTLGLVQYYWLVNVGDCGVDSGGGERQKEKFSALCKWEAKNHVTSKEGILVASYSTVFINIISWSWSCIIFCEKVWLVECHNFLNQQPKMIKIELIYGIIYQSICWHLDVTFWIVSKFKKSFCAAITVNLQRFNAPSHHPCPFARSSHLPGLGLFI